MKVNMLCVPCDTSRDFLYVEHRLCVCPICGNEVKISGELAFEAEYLSLPEDKRTAKMIKKLAKKNNIKLKEAKK